MGIEKEINTLAVLRRIAMESFGVPSDLVLYARTLRDAGFDSLSAADLIVEVEARFSISVAIEDLRSVRSLQDLSVVIDRLITRRTHCYDE